MNPAHPPQSEILSPEFYRRDALSLARDLLGKTLIHDSPEGCAAGRIVEVEAYRGPEDRAAHTFGGRRTPRNESMWGPGGRAYVYFCYGMHWCLNAVAGNPEEPEAVLLRGAEPLIGLDLISERRQGRGHPRRSLKGPACLCQGLGIDGSLDGSPLWEGALRIHDAHRVPDSEVGTSPRIGVDYAGDHAQRPWRFFVRGSLALSGRASLNR